MASFIIALVVLGLNMVLLVITATNIIGAGNCPSRSRTSEAATREWMATAAFAGGVAIYFTSCLSVPLCLTGIGLAIGGLVAHPKQKHLFTIVGLVGTGVVVLGVIGLHLFGALLAS